MRSILLGVFGVVVAGGLGACCHQGRGCESSTPLPKPGDPEKAASVVDPVHCPPYNGSDTETIRVIDLDQPHIMPRRETYYTFRYRKADPLNPQCLSLDFGKLCKCDVKSQTVVTSIQCSDGLMESVTEFVFKKGALLEKPEFDCPDRNAMRH
jgi:hypothetical protein